MNKDNFEENIMFLSPNIIRIGQTVISVKHITSFRLKNEGVLLIHGDNGEEFSIIGDKCGEYFESLINLLA